jgi:bis(5'-nucleosidyl)-tetraphosphatase
MTVLHENSAGVIPYQVGGDGSLRYLILHSATVRNPRARWEFPKGGIEGGETAREAAAREFVEETSLTEWSFREGFERSLSYTYVRRGRRVLKTVMYYIVEVRDTATLARSPEHVEDASGRWHLWGTFDAITAMLYHAKIRQLFAEADAWLRGVEPPAPEAGPDLDGPRPLFEGLGE